MRQHFHSCQPQETVFGKPLIESLAFAPLCPKQGNQQAHFLCQMASPTWHTPLWQRPLLDRKPGSKVSNIQIRRLK